MVRLPTVSMRTVPQAARISQANHDVEHRTQDPPWPSQSGHRCGKNAAVPSRCRRLRSSSWPFPAEQVAVMDGNNEKISPQGKEDEAGHRMNSTGRRMVCNHARSTHPRLETQETWRSRGRCGQDPTQNGRVRRSRAFNWIARIAAPRPQSTMNLVHFVEAQSPSVAK